MKSTGNELAFIRGLTLRKTLDVFGRLRTSSEDFGLLGESSEMIVPSSKIPAKKSQKKVGRYKMGRFYLSLHGVLEMLILIYRKYLHYFERPCSHGMCICDQQFSFGRIMFSPPPQQNFSRTPMATSVVVLVVVVAVAAAVVGVFIFLWGGGRGEKLIYLYYIVGYILSCLKVTMHLQIDNFLQIWIFESKYWSKCDL